MSFTTRVLLLVLAVPFVLATGGGCGGGQFRWDAKDCCLPKGGPRNPPKPPANTDCPFNWSWYSGKGCCAPNQPPNTLPPPQCPNGWSWSPASLRCTPPTTPTNPKPPSPSKKPEDCDDDKDKGGKGKDGKGKDNGGKDNGGKDGKGGNGHKKRIDIKKRQHRSRNVSPCPRGLSACPVSSLIGGDYECVDTLGDLDNCGGCAILGEGQNCNAIPGVWNVGCEQSACKIYTCAEGYTLSKDGESCHPL